MVDLTWREIVILQLGGFVLGLVYLGIAVFVHSWAVGSGLMQILFGVASLLFGLFALGCFVVSAAMSAALLLRAIGGMRSVVGA